MKCPICISEDVDREDHFDMSGARETPTAEYLCNDCGAHFEWRRGKPLHFYFNPKDGCLDLASEVSD